jgi:NitT/TauT family transport system substrate-binding protein
MAIVDLRRLTRSAALALLAALSSPLSAHAETAIHFTLDRKIDGPAAPFFLAIDEGYFKAQGLNVTINAASGPLESINRLASGSYDMGVADINLLIKFSDGKPDTPVKAVFVVFDKPPYALIARKSRGITAPNDLEGKKLESERHRYREGHDRECRFAGARADACRRSGGRYHRLLFHLLC